MNATFFGKKRHTSTGRTKMCLPRSKLISFLPKANATEVKMKIRGLLMLLNENAISYGEFFKN